MTKIIKQFDKTTLNILRKELKEVLNQIAKEQDLKIEIGGMKYSDHEVDVKLNILINGQMSRTQDQLKELANVMNLDLSLVAKHSDKELVLIDYKPKSSVWEFVVQDVNTGKRLLMKRNDVNKLFAKQV